MPHRVAVAVELFGRPIGRLCATSMPSGLSPWLPASCSPGRNADSSRREPVKAVAPCRANATQSRCPTGFARPAAVSNVLGGDDTELAAPWQTECVRTRSNCGLRRSVNSASTKVALCQSLSSPRRSVSRRYSALMADASARIPARDRWRVPSIRDRRRRRSCVQSHAPGPTVHVRSNKARPRGGGTVEACAPSSRPSPSWSCPAAWREWATPPPTR